MKPMRVLFVVRDSIAYERLGIAALSGCLKARGHETRMIVAGHHSRQQLHESVGAFAPDVVGYTAMTGEHIPLLEINRELKSRYRFVSVFGGAHATFFPQLVEEDGVDAICVGEGDESFPEFVDRLRDGGPYWETPCFHVKHGGAIHRNPVQPLVHSLDNLPLPDRAIIYEADPELAHVGTKHFMTARGCPYHCTYCFNDSFNSTYKDKGKVMRAWSPARVVEEIRWVKERYPMDRIYFIDDLFLLKPKGWIEEFCRIYKHEVGLPFSCTVRANVVKDEIIAMLRDAGLEFAWMGVECGDEEVANKVLKRGLRNDQLIHAAQVLARHGVRLITQNLVGLPVADPYATDLRTLDLNIEIQPAFGWSSILYPYPGTGIERMARETGHLEGTPEFLETNKRSTVLRFDDPLVKRRIENLHKLFGLVVRFSFLRRHIDFLCDLPLTGFYRLLYYLWYGYCLKVKLSPVRSFRKELPIFAKVFFRMLAKT